MGYYSLLDDKRQDNPAGKLGSPGFCTGHLYGLLLKEWAKGAT
jgi:hypothetical protein